MILPPPKATLAKRNNVGKTQDIRLLDIFVLGPAIMYAGLAKKPPVILSIFMVLTGIGTIAYNSYNYFRQQRRRELARQQLRKRPIGRTLF